MGFCENRILWFIIICEVKLLFWRVYPIFRHTQMGIVLYQSRLWGPAPTAFSSHFHHWNANFDCSPHIRRRCTLLIPPNACHDVRDLHLTELQWGDASHYGNRCMSAGDKVLTGSAQASLVAFSQRTGQCGPHLTGSIQENNPSNSFLEAFGTALWWLFLSLFSFNFQATTKNARRAGRIASFWMSTRLARPLRPLRTCRVTGLGNWVESHS